MKRGHSSTPCRRGATALALAVGGAIAAATISANRARANDSWIGTTGNWSTPGNWDQNRAPINTDIVFINFTDATNRTVTLDTTTTIFSMQLGNNGGGTTTLNQSSNFNFSATQGNERLAVTANAKAVHNQSAGNNTYASSLEIGYGQLSSGSYNLSGTGTITLSGTGTGPQGMFVGEVGNGSFTQTGTTSVTLLGIVPLMIASNAASTGVATIGSTSALFTTASGVFVGGSDLASGGTGTLAVSAGTMNIGGVLKVWNASSVINLSGSGTISAASLDLAGNNAALFNQTGGTFSQTASGTFLPTTTTGLNLSPASADEVMTGPAGGLTNTGNIIFDAPTGSFNDTFVGKITNNASKAVRIRGGGGGTRVINGYLDNKGAIAFNNADGTAFTVSSLNMENGSQDFPSLGPPGVANTINVTNASGITFSTTASSVGINVSSARNDSPSGFGVGTYTLFHYTGALNGSTAGMFKQSGSSGFTYSFYNDAANGNINVDVLPTAGVTFTGSIDGNWTTGSNWSGSVAPSSTQLATFPTPVPNGHTTITLASSQVSNGLRFNDNYTLTGGSVALTNALVNVAPGKSVTIASNLNAVSVFGSMGLIKAGPGTLTLTGANTYTGETVVSSGTLIAGANNTFPAGGTYSTPVGPVTTGGTIQVNSGTVDTGGTNQTVATMILSGGNININSGTVTTTNGVLVNAPTGSGAAINLHGGTLIAPTYATTANHSSLNWTGGTLQLTGTGTVPVSNIPAGTTLSLAPNSSNVVLTGQSTGATGPAKPAVISIASPNFYTNRSGAQLDAITIHTTEGSYAATISQFQTPGQDSANYVNNSDGSITEMVDPATGHAAFHATYYNDRAIGIENVGFSDQSSTWNSANVASLENLVAYLAYTYNVPLLRPTDNSQYNILQGQTTTGGSFNEPGIVAHAQIQPWDRYDPGQYFPWASFISTVQTLVANAITPAAVTNNGTLNVSNTGGFSVTYRGDINNVGAMNINSTNFFQSGIITNPGTITVSGGFSSIGTLSLTGAGKVTLTAGSGAVLRAQQLSLAGTSKIDLTDNKMIVPSAVTPLGSWNGSAYTGLTGLIATGRNGNAAPLWDGPTGIITSKTQATTGNYTSIAIAKGSEVKNITSTQTGTWAGQTISGSDTLVMYTYGGDATLDGKINVDDYIRIDNGAAAGLTGWSNGDFNYDGKVNIDDYTQFIDTNIITQGAPFSTSSGGPASDLGESVSAVPEPASVSLLMLLTAGATARRRRRPRT